MKKNRLLGKNMDDEGSTPRGSHISLVMKQAKNTVCCCCCGATGMVVNKFPRRGYGRSRSKGNAALQSSYIGGHYGKKRAS